MLWRPAWFGVKPEVVFKDGFLVQANTGPMNGVTLYAKPIRSRAMFGSTGSAPPRISHLFVSQAAADNPALRRQYADGRVLPVSGIRGLGKADMVRNDALPSVRVDPSSGAVSVDGEPVVVEPVASVPLNRRHLLL